MSSADPKPDEMTSMNVSLPEQLRQFITERAKGRFGSASEYLRELIREDQRRAAQEQLEAKLLAGLDSGESTPMSAADWHDLRQRVRDRAAAATKRAGV